MSSHHDFPREPRGNPHHADHDPAPDAPRMARPWRGEADDDYTPAAIAAAAAPAHSGLKLSLDDIYYVLFKHKWKIVICGVLGIVGAAGLYLAWPKVYLSEAKLLIKYIEDTTPTTPTDEDMRVSRPDQRGESIINTEIEILTSFDLAREVALAVGPARILPPDADVVEVIPAAAAIREGLVIASDRRSAVIAIQFQSPQAEIAQPVLQQLVDSYRQKHADIHRSSILNDDFLSHETDQLRARLSQTEEELRKLREQSNVLSLPDSRALYTEQLVRIRQSIMDAEAELAARRTVMTEMSGTRPSLRPPSADEPSGAPEPAVAADALSQYRVVTGLLTTLYRREQELLLQFTPESPLVRNVRSQIAENEAAKSRLEAAYPLLASQPARPLGGNTAGGVVGPQFDALSESAQVKAIEARIAVLKEQLARVQLEATAVSNIEPSISELERRKKLQEGYYEAFSRSLERARIAEAIGGNRISNISIVQAPTPPRPEIGKLYVILAGVAVGGLAFGLALAFAIELFLDPSIKRPKQVEQDLGLPLFLSIPRLGANGRAKALRAQSDGKGPRPSDLTSDLRRLTSGTGADTALVPWSVNNEFRAFFEALRDKVGFYFEIRNVTRKPKLVAVTGVSDESGVSTVAAGLAATLSEVGDGNVLLVDMNPGNQAPQFFHRGDLKLGLDEALDQGRREEASVGDNLYMVSSQVHSQGQSAAGVVGGGDTRLARILPTKFAHLVPKLKASDYDYIIFDLPRINQISATPQLSRYMDLTLMVVESEKDAKDVVRRAGDALKDAGANVGVVLNKTRSYVPKSLDQAGF